MTAPIPPKPANAPSVWNRGPPSNPTSGTSSPPNGNHSRKGSIMVGGGMDIKRGNLAFGTVDSPNPLLSSSPAAPSITGTHLADNVKSFGSIDADTDPEARKEVAPPKKQPDIHAMFGRRPSMNGQQQQNGLQNGQIQNGQQNGQMQNGPNGNVQNGPNGYGQFRQTRSPVMNPAQPNFNQGQFRPQMQSPQVRPNMQQQVRPMPPYMQGQYGYPQGFYPGFYEQQQQFGMPPQWAPQQHPQSQMMMRPPPQSPAQQPSGLPSPVVAPRQPTTPSRPMQPAPSFTPGSSFLSGGASSFTPRASKAIKIARPDGTELDLKKIAPTPAPEPEAPESPAPKKAYTLPVVVRIESEEQKKQRVKEEADREKIRAIEAKEEVERKERKERVAREAEQKRLDDEKREEERIAKEKSDKEAKEAEERASQEKEEKAQKDAAEKKVAETNEVSPPPTPFASIPSSPANLPPKPEISSPALSEVTERTSALITAKPIDDLSAITYPSTFNPPSPRLNANAEPGKFRYDREFLMQFMQVCKEKPEGLPSLEDIGLDDSSSGFGARNRNRAPPARGAPAGLGIGNLRNAPQGMGAFGMGNFGNIRGTTSEDRYQKSLSQTRGNGRAPSSGGLQGLPPMAASSSRGGHGRSQRGGRRQPAPSFAEPDVAPLAVSNNSWVKARPTDNDESSPAFVERKVKSLLNKLTEEKFDSISSQILEWANRSKNETDGMSLKLVIKQVFDKATDEAHWSSMYAKLCRKLLDDLDPEVTEIIDGKPQSGGVLFRKYLIGRCQIDFESGWKARETAATAAAAKSEEDKERLAQAEKDTKDGKEAEVAMLSDEYYAAQKAKRRGLGLVQLIGGLYKLEMISTKVIRTCLVKLLANLVDPDEEDVESTCKLLITVGGQFEVQGADSMAQVMMRMEAIKNLAGTSPRIKFMIRDIEEMRQQGWPKKNQAPTTIKEVHQQAAKEAQQKTAAANASISRGGSRAGRQRHDEWQTPQQPARLPQRPADTTNLGKITMSGANPTFSGPSSVFSKRGKAAVATPPISRQPSQANMSNAFSVLEADEPARKKLELQPRTVAKEEEEEEEEEIKTPTLMSEEAAKTKIASDMKELWGEKDQGGSRNPDDIAEYFKALPTERQPLLSIQLVDDAFRLSKYKEAEIIAKGLKAALDQNIPVDVLKKGIESHMVSLDDDSIDFPQAYKAMALFMRSLSLPDDDITTLLGMVDVYGEPKVTPKNKLDKALEQVDEEMK